MAAARALIFVQNEARIAASRAALGETHTMAQAEFEAALAAKWEAMTAALGAQEAAWEANVDARNMTMADAVQAARDAIADAKAASQAGLDASEKEVRWAITSIYNYDHQHALNELLTAARAAQDASCSAMFDDLNEVVDDVESTWAECAAAESGSLDANTEEETKRCEDAKLEQGDAFDAFKDAQTSRFEEWAADETAALEDFVADCDEAWEWILVSYCLSHGDSGVPTAGHGCSWGQGSGYGNGGFQKGVAVEDHQGVLEYEQELYIKHIPDIEALIEHAVEYIM